MAHVTFLPIAKRTTDHTLFDIYCSTWVKIYIYIILHINLVKVSNFGFQAPRLQRCPTSLQHRDVLRVPFEGSALLTGGLGGSMGSMGSPWECEFWWVGLA